MGGKVEGQMFQVSGARLCEGWKTPGNHLVLPLPSTGEKTASEMAGPRLESPRPARRWMEDFPLHQACPAHGPGCL